MQVESDENIDDALVPGSVTEHLLLFDAIMEKAWDLKDNAVSGTTDTVLSLYIDILNFQKSVVCETWRFRRMGQASLVLHLGAQRIR